MFMPSPKTSPASATLQAVAKVWGYYSDDEERARWAKDFPDFPMPPREKPPYSRDRQLPKAEH